MAMPLETVHANGIGLDVAIKAKMRDPPIGVAGFSVAVARWNPPEAHKVQNTESNSPPLAGRPP
jgi:hypothetical protein